MGSFDSGLAGLVANSSISSIGCGNPAAILCKNVMNESIFKIFFIYQVFLTAFRNA